MFKKIFFSLGLLIMLVPVPALAKGTIAQGSYDPSEFPKLANPTATVAGTGPTAKVKVSGLVGNIIKTVLGIVGSISLVILIYAGVRYMGARGNAEESKKALATALWAFLGVLVIFFSYLILNLVFKTLTIG